MTLGDVLDGAFKLLKANATTILAVTALFVVPVQLLTAFLQRDVLDGSGLFDMTRDPLARLEVESSSDGTAEIVAGIVALVASSMVLPFVSGAVSRVVASSYLGAPMGAGVALRAARRRWWALVGAWFLVHLLEASGLLLAGVVLVVIALAGAPTAGVVVGLVLLGLGGLAIVLLMPLFVAVAPAVVVEELGPWRAVRRSAGLLRRRYRATLGIALASGFLASVVGSALGFVPQLAGLLVGSDRGGWLLVGAGSALSQLVTLPLVAIVATLVYFDGRIRHEGFDLQVIAADLAAGEDRR
jgi:hypothetical protein